MAHEATGTGTWSRGTQSVPVTGSNELLAVLDISDAKHPKLVRTMTVNTDDGADEPEDDAANEKDEL
jgi:hypothetical protein